jgi:hypothetical protein
MTVESYLNDYMRTPKSRHRFSARFYYYIISSCWRKLYRRIKGWAGLGFIHNLLHCRNGGEVRTWISLYNWNQPSRSRGPGDSTLCKYLRDTTGIFADLTGGTHLKMKMKLLEDFLEKAKSCLDSDKPLYNKDTAEGFHELLLAALYHFGLGLAGIYQASNLSNDNAERMDKLTQAIIKTEGFARLFFYIVSSSAFDTHIRVCTENGAAISQLAPIYSHRKTYQSTATDLGILPGKHWGKQLNKKELDELDDPDEYPESVGENAKPIFQRTEVNKVGGFFFCKLRARLILCGRLRHIPTQSPPFVTSLVGSKLSFSNFLGSERWKNTVATSSNRILKPKLT